MNKLPQNLFHYTIGPSLRKIQQSGVLIPKGYGQAASSRERPVLWFSENPVWEPTANKVMSLDNSKTFFRPSIAELHEVAGLFRFRVDPAALAAHEDHPVKIYDWSRIQRLAHIASVDVGLMVTRGMKFGSTPMHWWGTLEPVRLSMLEEGLMKLEARSAPAPGEGPNVWHEVALADAVEAFLAKGLRYKVSTTTETPAARNL